MNRAHPHNQKWLQSDSNEVEILSFLDGIAAVYSHSCPTDDSKTNEDGACLVEVESGRGLIAVADGMGGASAGEVAAKSVIEQVCQRCCEQDFYSSDPNSQLRSKILDAIESSNIEIMNWKIGAGTTLTAVEIAGNRFRHFHVGDSGAIQIGGRGRIKFSTVGHAPVAQAVELGMLDDQEALEHEDRNLITNCIGSDEMKVEVGIFRSMSVLDTLLVASDGLFDNVTKEEISQLICGGELHAQTSRLVDIVNRRMLSADAGKPDDLTIVCYRPSGLKKTKSTRSV